MLIVAKHKATEADIVDWLSTVNGFIEGLTEVDNEPTDLEDFQIRINDDPARTVFTEKARQVGWSWNRAAHALAKSHLRDRYLRVFVSYNLDDAKEKILYARTLYESMPRRFQEKLTNDSALSLGFKNGSRLVTMFRPRGKGPADVDIDEPAHMAKAREIYNAAQGMTARRGQIHIGSTHFGQGFFWEMATNKDGRYSRFSRHKIYWWDSRYLCTNVKEARERAPVLTTEERVYKYGTPALQEIFDSMLLEDFQEEFELVPQADVTSYISIEDILACANPELKVYDDFEELKKQCRGPLYGGFDVGRRRHPSVLFVLERLEDNFYQRLMKTFAGESFEAQKHQLREFIDITQPVRLCIDETGIGMNLAEDLWREYPAVVEGINFAERIETELPAVRGERPRAKQRKSTVAIKERLASNVKILFENRGITIYADRRLVNQIHSIKRITGIGGYVRYDTDKNERHHADMFWALALSLHGAVTGLKRKRILVQPTYRKLKI
jgi:phage FluMu gp28-like protein